jgi:hypothetical protein
MPLAYARVTPSSNINRDAVPERRTNMFNINQMIQDTLDNLNAEERNLSDEYMYESGHRPLCGRILSFSWDRELNKLREEYLMREPVLSDEVVEAMVVLMGAAVDKLHSASDERARIKGIPAFRHLCIED